MQNQTNKFKHLSNIALEEQTTIVNGSEVKVVAGFAQYVTDGFWDFLRFNKKKRQEWAKDLQERVTGYNFFIHGFAENVIQGGFDYDQEILRLSTERATLVAKRNAIRTKIRAMKQAPEIVLLQVNDDEITVENFQNISKGKPIIIKQANQYFIYGYNGNNWFVTEFRQESAAALNRLLFPESSSFAAPNTSIIKQENIPEEVFDEIEAINGHKGTGFGTLSDLKEFVNHEMVLLVREIQPKINTLSKEIKRLQAQKAGVKQLQAETNGRIESLHQEHHDPYGLFYQGSIAHPLNCFDNLSNEAVELGINVVANGIDSFLEVEQYLLDSQSQTLRTGLTKEFDQKYQYFVAKKKDQVTKVKQGLAQTAYNRAVKYLIGESMPIETFEKYEDFIKTNGNFEVYQIERAKLDNVVQELNDDIKKLKKKSARKNRDKITELEILKERLLEHKSDLRGIIDQESLKADGSILNTLLGEFNAQPGQIQDQIDAMSLLNVGGEENGRPQYQNLDNFLAFLNAKLTTLQQSRDKTGWFGRNLFNSKYKINLAQIAFIENFIKQANAAKNVEETKASTDVIKIVADSAASKDFIKSYNQKLKRDDQPELYSGTLLYLLDERIEYSADNIDDRFNRLVTEYTAWLQSRQPGFSNQVNFNKIKTSPLSDDEKRDDRLERQKAYREIDGRGLVLFKQFVTQYNSDAARVSSDQDRYFKKYLEMFAKELENPGRSLSVRLEERLENIENDFANMIVYHAVNDGNINLVNSYLDMIEYRLGKAEINDVEAKQRAIALCRRLVNGEEVNVAEITEQLKEDLLKLIPQAKVGDTGYIDVAQLLMSRYTNWHYEQKYARSEVRRSKSMAQNQLIASYRSLISEFAIRDLKHKFLQPAINAKLFLIGILFREQDGKLYPRLQNGLGGMVELGGRGHTEVNGVNFNHTKQTFKQQISYCSQNSGQEQELDEAINYYLKALEDSQDNLDLNQLEDYFVVFNSIFTEEQLARVARVYFSKLFSADKNEVVIRNDSKLYAFYKKNRELAQFQDAVSVCIANFHMAKPNLGWVRQTSNTILMVGAPDDIAWYTAKRIEELLQLQLQDDDSAHREASELLRYIKAPSLDTAYQIQQIQNNKELKLALHLRKPWSRALDVLSCGLLTDRASLKNLQNLRINQILAFLLNSRDIIQFSKVQQYVECIKTSIYPNLTFADETIELEGEKSQARLDAIFEEFIATKLNNPADPNFNVYVRIGELLAKNFAQPIWLDRIRIKKLEILYQKSLTARQFIAENAGEPGFPATEQGQTELYAYFEKHLLREEGNQADFRNYQYIAELEEIVYEYDKTEIHEYADIYTISLIKHLCDTDHDDLLQYDQKRIKKNHPSFVDRSRSSVPFNQMIQSILIERGSKEYPQPYNYSSQKEYFAFEYGDESSKLLALHARLCHDFDRASKPESNKETTENLLEILKGQRREELAGLIEKLSIKDKQTDTSLLDQLFSHYLSEQMPWNANVQYLLENLEPASLNQKYLKLYRMKRFTELYRSYDEKFKISEEEYDSYQRKLSREQVVANKTLKDYFGEENLPQIAAVLFKYMEEVLNHPEKYETSDQFYLAMMLSSDYLMNLVPEGGFKLWQKWHQRFGEYQKQVQNKQFREDFFLNLSQYEYQKASMVLNQVIATPSESNEYFAFVRRLLSGLVNYVRQLVSNADMSVSHQQEIISAAQKICNAASFEEQRQLVEEFKVFLLELNSQSFGSYRLNDIVDVFNRLEMQRNELIDKLIENGLEQSFANNDVEYFQLNGGVAKARNNIFLVKQFHEEMDLNQKRQLASNIVANYFSSIVEEDKKLVVMQLAELRVQYKDKLQIPQDVFDNIPQVLSNGSNAVSKVKMLLVLIKDQLGESLSQLLDVVDTNVQDAELCLQNIANAKAQQQQRLAITTYCKRLCEVAQANNVRELKKELQQSTDSSSIIYRSISKISSPNKPTPGSPGGKQVTINLQRLGNLLIKMLGAELVAYHGEANVRSVLEELNKLPYYKTMFLSLTAFAEGQKFKLSDSSEDFDDNNFISTLQQLAKEAVTRLTAARQLYIAEVCKKSSSVDDVEKIIKQEFDTNEMRKTRRLFWSVVTLNEQKNFEQQRKNLFADLVSKLPSDNPDVQNAKKAIQFINENLDTINSQFRQVMAVLESDEQIQEPISSYHALVFGLDSDRKQFMLSQIDDAIKRAEGKHNVRRAQHLVAIKVFIQTGMSLEKMSVNPEETSALKQEEEKTQRYLRHLSIINTQIEKILAYDTQVAWGFNNAQGLIRSLKIIEEYKGFNAIQEADLDKFPAIRSLLDAVKQDTQSYQDIQFWIEPLAIALNGFSKVDEAKLKELSSNYFEYCKVKVILDSTNASDKNIPDLLKYATIIESRPEMSINFNIFKAAVENFINNILRKTHQTNGLHDLALDELVQRFGNDLQKQVLRAKRVERYFHGAQELKNIQYLRLNLQEWNSIYTDEVSEFMLRRAANVNVDQILEELQTKTYVDDNFSEKEKLNISNGVSFRPTTPSHTILEAVLNMKYVRTVGQSENDPEELALVISQIFIYTQVSNNALQSGFGYACLHDAVSKLLTKFLDEYQKCLDSGEQLTKNQSLFVDKIFEMLSGADLLRYEKLKGSRKMFPQISKMVEDTVNVCKSCFAYQESTNGTSSPSRFRMSYGSSHFEKSFQQHLELLDDAYVPAFVNFFNTKARYEHGSTKAIYSFALDPNIRDKAELEAALKDIAKSPAKYKQKSIVEEIRKDIESRIEYHSSAMTASAAGEDLELEEISGVFISSVSERLKAVKNVQAFVTEFNKNCQSKLNDITYEFKLDENTNSHEQLTREILSILSNPGNYCNNPGRANQFVRN